MYMPHAFIILVSLQGNCIPTVDRYVPSYNYDTHTMSLKHEYKQGTCPNIDDLDPYKDHVPSFDMDLKR